MLRNGGGGGGKEEVGGGEGREGREGGREGGRRPCSSHPVYMCNSGCNGVSKRSNVCTYSYSRYTVLAYTCTYLLLVEEQD